MVKCIVVGAGLSGLVAAQELRDHGLDVVVLEAGQRVGGRLYTARGGLHDDQVAEIGAERIYPGQHLMLTLCERAGVDLRECPASPASGGSFLRGRWLNSDATADLAGAAQNQLETHPPGPYESLVQWMRRVHLRDDESALLSAAAQSTPAAPLRLTPAAGIGAGLPGTLGGHEIRGGVDRLATGLARGLEVHTGTEVVAVSWTGPGVTVESRQGRWRGDAVLLAVPGPVLTEIAFEPLLDPWKVQALLGLRFGEALRVIAQYDERALIDERIGAGVLTDTQFGFIGNQTVGQPGSHAVLSCLVAGDLEPCAGREHELLAQFDDVVTELLQRQATRSFGLTHSWSRDPFTRGTVRVPWGNQVDTVIPALAAPMGATVFFAGEHTDPRTTPGGMNGAAASGIRAAREILSLATG